MKKYFIDIKKPKWYIIVLALFLFVFQCMSVINLCFQFGGGYYLIIPVQFFTGYLDVLIFLMVQKDIKKRDFTVLAILSAVLGVVASILLFDNLYTSVPSVKGVFNGAIMNLMFAMAFYALLRTVREMISARKSKKPTQEA